MRKTCGKEKQETEIQETEDLDWILTEGLDSGNGDLPWLLRAGHQLQPGVSPQGNKPINILIKVSLTYAPESSLEQHPPKSNSGTLHHE